MKFNDTDSVSRYNTGRRQVNVRAALKGVDLKIECFLWFVLQEILQIHFNKKFWGSEHQRISSSVFVKCDDGAEEMLQPSIPVLFCGPGKYVSLIFMTCLTLLFQTWCMVQKKIDLFTHFESSKFGNFFLMIVHDIQVTTLLLICCL